MKFFILSIICATAAVSAYDLAASNTIDQKQQYCRDNQFRCSVYCNGVTSVNSCDAETLSWECKCGGGRGPTVTKFEFPIEIAQCDGELLECVDKCLVTLKPDRNFCSAKCKDEKKCGTNKSTQTKVWNADKVNTDDDTATKSWAFRVGVNWETAAILMLMKHLIQ